MRNSDLSTFLVARCNVHGYKRAYSAVKQYVRSSDAVKRSIARIAKNRYGESKGKMQNVQMIFVNESGFYALVLGSKLASTVKFKDWVTSVVLPQTRKTGGYITAEAELIGFTSLIYNAIKKE